VIAAVVQERFASLDEQRRVFLRGFLRAWLQERAATPGLPPGIRNKMAHLFALVFVCEFPTTWPSFFQDLGANVTASAALAEFFVRVMLAIDEEVVDRDIVRSRDATAHNSALKDSVRLVMADICETWHSIISTFGTGSPALTGLCLRCVSLYTAWIDINFVVHERFLTPIFQYFQLNTPELRDGACDCLNGLVNKGMPPQNKIQLIRSLQIAERVSAAKGALHDNINDFALRLARLANATAVAALSSLLK
jgi:exportin-T